PSRASRDHDVGVTRPRSWTASRTLRPLAHDARLRSGPALAGLHEEERQLAMEAEAPSVPGAHVLVLVVAGRDERDAAHVADGLAAPPAARAGGAVEGDRQVVDEVHARLEARPEPAQVRRHGGMAAMGARSVRAVVPDDVGMAEREKRLHVGLGMARVTAVMDEAVLCVQVTDGLAVLEAAEEDSEVVGGRHGPTLEPPSRARQFGPMRTPARGHSAPMCAPL